MRLALALLALTACADPAPTWHDDVAPIVAAHCGSCHTEGNIAPFALDDYASASALGAAMVAAVDEGRMPPFLAKETDECQPLRPWKDDLRLSDEEKEVLRAWVDAGTPEGNPKHAAELPSPPELSIANPSLDLPFAEPYTVQGSRDDFQCFVLDPGNDETMWVTAAQVTPGNKLVDHHGLLFVDVNGGGDALAGDDGRFPCFTNPSLDGYLLATWTPGATPMRTPENAAMPIPAGARLIVQMHYHPTTEPQVDRSSVQIEWSNQTPEWAAAQALLGNERRQDADGDGLQPGPNDRDKVEFFIPAGVQGHTETMRFTLPQAVPIDLPIFSVGTHMHYVGTDMKIDLTRPVTHGDEPAEECLIQTPDWDFNWQRVYNYDTDVDDLPKMSGGDSLLMRCTYDNSRANPAVVAALAEQGLSEPHDVNLGEETLDEMCLGLFGILLPPAMVETLY